MNNQEEVLQAPAPHKTVTIQQDPFEKSFQDSAIQYIPYKVCMLGIALALLQLGKSSLPEDAVPCIQDVVNQALRGIADFLNRTRGFGLTLMTIMQLVCDIQLVGMVIYWVIWGKSFTYPLSVAFLGIAKVLINVVLVFMKILFKTRDIQNAFKDRLFVSLLFGQNFENTYFFSGIIGFLVINLLQFWNYGYRRLFYIQIGIIIFVMFLLLAMQLNFFMDVITSLAFGYIVYTLIDSKRESIDNFLLNPKTTINKWLGKDEEQSTQTRNN